MENVERKEVTYAKAIVLVFVLEWVSITSVGFIFPILV